MNDEIRIPYRLLIDEDEQARCQFSGWGNGYHAAREKRAIDEVDSNLLEIMLGDWSGVPQSETFVGYGAADRRFWMAVYCWNYEMGFCFAANPARVSAVPGIPFKGSFTRSEWENTIPLAVSAGWLRGRYQFWKQYYDTNSAEMIREGEGIILQRSAEDINLTEGNEALLNAFGSGYVEAFKVYSAFWLQPRGQQEQVVFAPPQ